MRIVTRANTTPPRDFFGSIVSRMPFGSALRTVRASITWGVALNASPAATVCEPVYPRTIVSTSGASGTSVRSGFAVGTNTPTVRLSGLRYAVATRCTSAGVTALMRSRVMCSRRQSPEACASVSA